MVIADDAGFPATMHEAKTLGRVGLPALRVVGVERAGYDVARLCGGCLPLGRLQSAGG